MHHNTISDLIRQATGQPTLVAEAPGVGGVLSVDHPTDGLLHLGRYRVPSAWL